LSDLKEVILATLEELESDKDLKVDMEKKDSSFSSLDRDFLEKLRIKLLVLFEGLQSPNIVELDKKLDLTINFLEYTLAMIDKKLNDTK
jgi:hypothetical protein